MRSLHIAFIIILLSTQTSPSNSQIIIQTHIKTTENNMESNPTNAIQGNTYAKEQNTPKHVFIISSKLATETISNNPIKKEKKN